MEQTTTMAERSNEKKGNEDKMKNMKHKKHGRWRTLNLGGLAFCLYLDKDYRGSRKICIWGCRCIGVFLHVSY